LRISARALGNSLADLSTSFGPELEFTASTKDGQQAKLASLSVARDNADDFEAGSLLLNTVNNGITQTHIRLDSEGKTSFGYSNGNDLTEAKAVVDIKGSSTTSTTSSFRT